MTEMNTEWIMDDGCFNDRDPEINNYKPSVGGGPSHQTEYTLDSLVAEANTWDATPPNTNIWEIDMNTYNNGLVSENIVVSPSSIESDDDMPELESCHDEIIVEGTASVLHTNNESELKNFPKVEQMTYPYRFNETHDGYDINSLTSINYQGGIQSDFCGNIYIDEVFSYISLGGYMSHEHIVLLNDRCAETILNHHYPDVSIETAKTEKIYPYNKLISKTSHPNPITGTSITFKYHNFNVCDYAILAKVCVDFMIEYKEHILY